MFCEEEEEEEDEYVARNRTERNKKTKTLIK